MNKEIVFYQTIGVYPVINFIEGLSHEIKAEIIRYFDLLEEYGLELGEPYLCHLDKGKNIWELKIPLGNKSLIFFFLNSETCYLMIHGILKDKKTDYAKELSIVLQRADEYLQ